MRAVKCTRLELRSKSKLGGNSGDVCVEQDVVCDRVNHFEKIIINNQKSAKIRQHTSSIM